MRDLAVIVSLILLAILILGFFAVFTVLRSPQSKSGKIFVGVIDCAALFSGAWLALLEVGNGARLIGAVVFIAGALSLFRLLRKV